MISTKNISLFKKSLESISGLIQETNVRFKDQGIFIKAVDSAQVVLIDFFIPKKAFDNYVVEPNLTGLNINELYNMVSRSFEKDVLKINLKENYMQINLIGQIQRKFNLSYIDITEKEINTPNIEYDAKIKLNSNLLKEIIKDASLVSSTITFKVINNKFILSSIGDKGKIETNFPKVKVSSKKNISVKFSLSYLKNIIKHMDSDKEVILKFSDDSPLYIEYMIDDIVTVKYYLSSMLL